MAGCFSLPCTEGTNTEESGVRGGRTPAAQWREYQHRKMWPFLYHLSASGIPEHFLSELQDVTFCMHMPKSKIKIGIYFTIYDLFVEA